MQSESRAGTKIDVRRHRIIEHEAEDLPDLPGCNRIALWLVDPVVAKGRLSRSPDINNAADHSIDIDGKCGLPVRPWSRRHAREARHERFTDLKSPFLRHQRSNGPQCNG